ncbi:MAG: hypothetical protein K0S33_370 [Bacteroidetes bacterium]|jgi:uncharacterized membrane protein YcaP (DUF421 family)|nr:hypothetical protein [Bacteroidota bacterium]
MNQDRNIEVFDWQRIFGTEHIPVSYLGEIAFRTTVMFLILVIALKFLSKRGVKQLSVFELAILIALGSAVGDPMFYNYIPLTYGILVLIVVILLYRSITRFTSRSKMMERLLEGKPVCLLENGRIDFRNYRRIRLPYDKFFAELRLKGVDHLGQVRRAYLETSGEISIYFFKDEEVLPGLPIYPEWIDQPVKGINEGKDYACIYCGNVQYVQITGSECRICKNNKWLTPLATPRVV